MAIFQSRSYRPVMTTLKREAAGAKRKIWAQLTSPSVLALDWTKPYQKKAFGIFRTRLGAGTMHHLTIRRTSPMRRSKK